MDNTFEMYQKSGPLLYASPKSLFKEIVIFDTGILTGKVVLWCFFLSETSEKSTIQLFKSKSQYRT